MDLSDKTQLIQYLKLNGLYTKHSLGQNFLVDREVLEKIVETAEIAPDDLVIEIGPGVGTLTVELVKKAGKIIAVEMDDKLAELLGQLFHCSIVPLLGSKDNRATCPSGRRVEQSSNLEIINADILKLNISELTKDCPAYKVVANIPYYITSKILQLFLTLENKPESITLLVQKEVAERICAKPGHLSVLAISVQAYGEPEIISVVPKESFFPAPAVDSAIIRIKTHKFRRVGESESRREKLEKTLPLSLSATQSLGEKAFFRTVHIGFASKRKTLANNLSAGYHIDKTTASAIIKSVGLSENVRAQELSIEDWAKFAQTLNQELRITN